MRKPYVMIVSVLLCSSLSGCYYFMNGLSIGASYGIGDSGPAGGYIFHKEWTEEDSWMYMEAAPNDQGNYPWGSQVETGVKDGSIGSGISNTRALIEKLGVGATSALVCDNLIINGFDDWFLPSNNELAQILLLGMNGTGGIKKNTIYWSSTDFDAAGAMACWIDDMNTICTTSMPKTDGLVRAARQFHN